MKDTAIEWTDHSWSPWWGCTKVSPGCTHCYAAAWAKWTRGIVYAKGQPRVKTKDWESPRRWNAEAAATGRRMKVFPSMMDWLDDEVSIEWLAEFLALVADTPHLDWLLLTKRPENYCERLAAAVKGSAQAPRNVWVGATVEDHKQAWRISRLLEIPGHRRFLSCEPLLGSLQLDLTGIDWVIAGGESGPNARPMHPDWVREIRDRCLAMGVPFFFKQWGEWAEARTMSIAEMNAGPARNGYVWVANNGDVLVSERRGKKTSGRILDGRTWEEVPA